MTGCRVLDKSKPPLFISFAEADGTAWDGEKYVKAFRLKINNNSSCALVFTAEYGSSTPSVRIVIKNGKPVRPSDMELGALVNGQKANLLYYMKYADEKTMTWEGIDGHLLETVRLSGGDYIFMSVPVKNFKKDGELLVPFNYEWDQGRASSVNVGDTNELSDVVQHYLRFRRELLPPSALKFLSSNSTQPKL